MFQARRLQGHPRNDCSATCQHQEPKRQQSINDSPDRSNTTVKFMHPDTASAQKRFLK